MKIPREGYRAGRQMRTGEATTNSFTRLFLFYDRAAENSALPCVAEHWSEPARAVSRCA